MSQPVPIVSAEDVERVIQREFGAEVRDAVRKMLADVEGARTQLAVLKLAEGRVEATLQYVEIAKRDFRDILAMAEYPRYMQVNPIAVQRLPAKEREALIRADWAEYQSWLGADPKGR